MKGEATVNAATLWWSATILAQSVAGQAAGPADNATVQVQSVWDFMVKGGPIMIPIALCSLAALAVIIERLFSLRRNKVIPPGLVDKVRAALNGTDGDPQTALACCRDDGSSIANVFLAGLKKLHGSDAQREKAVQEAGEWEVFKLRKYLRLLSVVATLAPVMGLLGTVFGMIKAFQTVAVSGEALGKTELLARGIYEALITTAAGLLLAIPVLIAYHWMVSKIERLVHDMDQITIEFFEERREAVAPEARQEAKQPRLAAARIQDQSEHEALRTVAAPA
jgi:biopolymer transport protein ExbB